MCIHCKTLYLLINSSLYQPGAIFLYYYEILASASRSDAKPVPLGVLNTVSHRIYFNNTPGRNFAEYGEY